MRTATRSAQQRRIASWRARSRRVDVVAETVARYRRRRLGRTAALLSHYGFLSAFPLLVCFTTILGFVLQGDPGLQSRIVDSAFGQFPVIGQQLRADAGSLRGNGVILAVALVTAIWAGLRAFVVAHTAIDDIVGVPDDERLGLVRGRLRAFATTVVIGLAQVLTATSAALLSVTPVPGVAQAGVLAVAGALDIVLVALAFRLLCSRPLTWRSVLPGAVITGLGFVGLQLVGSLVVGRAITRATPVYGTFATVIGILTWLSLHAMLALVGIQFDVVLLERRPGRPPVARAAQ